MLGLLIYKKSKKINFSYYCAANLSLNNISLQTFSLEFLPMCLKTTHFGELFLLKLANSHAQQCYVTYRHEQNCLCILMHQLIGATPRNTKPCSPTAFGRSHFFEFRRIDNARTVQQSSVKVIIFHMKSYQSILVIFAVFHNILFKKCAKCLVVSK